MNHFLKALVVFALGASFVRADEGTGIDSANRSAWSENAGWINFAPSNGGVSVHFDETAGYLTGYAWGENIGWIRMSADENGPFGNDSVTNWGVNLDAAGYLSGYAWSENAGWIKLNPDHGGVTINTTNGHFDGYAWGENIGWIKFQGSGPNYNVRTRAFDKQPQGTPNWWLDRHGVTEEYDEGDEIPSWEEYVADTDPNEASSFFRLVAISNLSQAASIAFTSSGRRYYTLCYCNDLKSGVWSNVPDQKGVPGADGTYSLRDTNPVSRLFYRIAVDTLP